MNLDSDRVVQIIAIAGLFFFAGLAVAYLLMGWSRRQREATKEEWKKKIGDLEQRFDLVQRRGLRAYRDLCLLVDRVQGHSPVWQNRYEYAWGRGDLARMDQLARELHEGAKVSTAPDEDPKRTVTAVYGLTAPEEVTEDPKPVVLFDADPTLPEVQMPFPREKDGRS